METRKLVLMALGIKGFFILMVGMLIIVHRYMVAQTFLETASTIEEIKFELQSGDVDVNTYDEDDGVTGLMLAASLGDLARVKLLLEHGADPNLKAKATPDNVAGETAGYTALHYALRNSDMSDAKELIKVFLAAGASPNIPNYFGKTAVHLVLEGTNDLDKRIELLRLLVDNGADVNAGDNKGNTLLHDAVSNNDVTFLEKLYKSDLAEKFNIYIANNDGCTFLQYAMFLGLGDLLDAIKRVASNNTELVTEIDRILAIGQAIECPSKDVEPETGGPLTEEEIFVEESIEG